MRDARKKEALIPKLIPNFSGDIRKTPFLKAFFGFGRTSNPSFSVATGKDARGIFFVDKISMERNVVFIIRSFMYDS